MGSIRLRPDNGNLFFDFHYLGKRCREQTSLKDTKANRKLTEAALEKIEADIVSSNFEYAKYFPNSKMVEKFNGGPISSLIEKRSTVTHPLMQDQPLSSPIFETFANTWFDEMKISWRRSYIVTIRLTLDKYLIAEFGERLVHSNLVKHNLNV